MRPLPPNWPVSEHSRNTRRKPPFSWYQRKACTIKFHRINISRLIRSHAEGSDEVRRGLCYDEHHIWRVTVVVTLPDILPCVLRGEVGPMSKDSSSPALRRNIKRYWSSRRLCCSRSCSASVLNIMRRRAGCLIIPTNSIEGCSLW